VHTFRKAALSVVPVLAITFLPGCSGGPKIAPATNIAVDKSPERIERGRYLYVNLGDCDSCHSERDYTRLYAPVMASGKGSVIPYEGLPGRIVASNITPDPETGIGTWTDGEKIRAIREGISKDGHALHPIMPYQNYRYMSEQDVQALVAHMDTLPAIRNPLPKTELSPAALRAIQGVPRPVDQPMRAPDPNHQASYGEYLVTIASCEECHTPKNGGRPDAARRFAGGQAFATRFGTVVTANITPDRDTGIGSWDYARFRDRLQVYRKEYSNPAQLPKIGPERFTVMHYIAYSGLADSDIAAVFTYLRTRTPVTQSVEPHPASPPKGK
jgi:hypothetical protein